MDGDITDSIPDLLLAEEAEEIDALYAQETFGIQSIFKIRCEVMDIDGTRGYDGNQDMSSDSDSGSQHE